MFRCDKCLYIRFLRKKENYSVNVLIFATLGLLINGEKKS